MINLNLEILFIYQFLYALEYNHQFLDILDQQLGTTSLFEATANTAVDDAIKTAPLNENFILLASYNRVIVALGDSLEPQLLKYIKGYSRLILCSN